MIKFSLRRYEDQARASLVLGVAALLSLLAQAALVFRHVDFSQWVVYYGNPSRRILVFCAAASTLLLGLGALGFGFSSAGQRRNEKPTLSWLGFFLGAGAICFAVIFVFFFYKQAEYIRVTP